MSSAPLRRFAAEEEDDDDDDGEGAHNHHHGHDGLHEDSSHFLDCDEDASGVMSLDDSADSRCVTATSSPRHSHIDTRLRRQQTRHCHATATPLPRARHRPPPPLS